MTSRRRFVDPGFKPILTRPINQYDMTPDHER
jgi:hypothetical protein